MQNQFVLECNRHRRELSASLFRNHSSIVPCGHKSSHTSCKKIVVIDCLSKEVSRANEYDSSKSAMGMEEE